MALFLQYQGEDYHWAVWKLEETLEELLPLFPDSRKYRQEVEKFSSAHPDNPDYFHWDDSPFTEIEKPDGN